MSSINKEIKNYLVQIEFNGHTREKQNGSGVIISSTEFEQESLELKTMNKELKNSLSKSDNNNAVNSLKLIGYQNKIENLKKIIIKLGAKNEQIHKFEKKLEEIKNEKRKEPKITLKLIRADLEKIESIINENKRPIWNIYFKTRFVILTLIFLIPITVCIIEDFSECIILFNNIFSK